MVEIGKSYYFIQHAYYHIVGEVTEIIGVRRVALKNAVKIHSCKRNWTEFLKDGFKKDTQFDVIGNIADTSYISAYEWNH